MKVRSIGCAKRVERCEAELSEARASGSPWLGSRVRAAARKLAYARVELARAIEEEEVFAAEIALKAA